MPVECLAVVRGSGQGINLPDMLPEDVFERRMRPQRRYQVVHLYHREKNQKRVRGRRDRNDKGNAGLPRRIRFLGARTLTGLVGCMTGLKQSPENVGFQYSEFVEPQM